MNKTRQPNRKEDETCDEAIHKREDTKHNKCVNTSSTLIIREVQIKLSEIQFLTRDIDKYLKV